MSKLLAVLSLAFVLALSVGAHGSFGSTFVAKAVVYPLYENIISDPGNGAFGYGCGSGYGTYPDPFNDYMLAGGPIGSGAYITTSVYGLNRFTAGIPFYYPIGYAAFNFTKTSASTCVGSTVRLDSVKSNFVNNSVLTGSPLSAYQVLGSFIESAASPEEVPFDVFNDSTMDGLYNNSAAWTMQSVRTASSGCGGTGLCYNGINIFAHLNESRAGIVLYLYNGLAGTLDVSISPFQSNYYDFESGKDTNYNFPLAEFQYLLTDHNIYPKVPMWHVGQQARSIVETNPWEWCDNPAYSMSNVFVNADPDSGFDDLFCFNLTTQHGGDKYFYGLLDVINNTGNRFYFKAFIFGVNLTFFNNVQLSPVNPTIQDNLTISVNFSYAMKGRLLWQKILGGIPQTPEMDDDPSVQTFHSFMIPSSNYSVNTTITWWIEGYDDGLTQNFKLMQPTTTTTFLNVTPIYPGIPTDISPYDDVRNRIGAGANFIIDTAPCPLCVPPQMHLSIPAWCRVDNLTERSTHYYDITPINSTSPSSAHVSTWTLAEINGTGFHNVTCRPTVSNEFLFQPNTTVVNVSGDPFYYLVRLPNIPSCDALVLFNRTRCEIEMLNRTPGYYDAWYCRERGPPSYPSSYCGLYEGFGCPNASLVPSGYAVNGSTANINCIMPPAGNFTQPPANFTVPPALANNTVISNLIYNWLGMTPYVFLNFLSLIMSVVLAILVAVKSKSGLATGIVFVGGIFVFAVVGWLPIWVLIVLGVLTAFLVARFASETIFGGGK
jgi:hypothetical protein